MEMLVVELDEETKQVIEHGESKSDIFWKWAVF
jgi:hypothetical protein